MEGSRKAKCHPASESLAVIGPRFWKLGALREGVLCKTGYCVNSTLVGFAIGITIATDIGHFSDRSFEQEFVINRLLTNRHCVCVRINCGHSCCSRNVRSWSARSSTNRRMLLV